MGSLDFQKLLFLYCQESKDLALYTFVPYRFGCFSFTSYADKRKLVERDFLEEKETVWRLTPAGKAIARLSPENKDRVVRFASRYANLRGDALIRFVYRRFP